MILRILATTLFTTSILYSHSPQPTATADPAITQIVEKISDTFHNVYGLSPTSKPNHEFSFTFEAPYLIEERRARELVLSYLFDARYIIENEASRLMRPSVIDSFSLILSFYGPDHTRPAKPHVGTIEIKDSHILYRYFAEDQTSENSESFREALVRAEQQSVDDLAACEDVIMQALDKMIEKYAGQ